MRDYAGLIFLKALFRLVCIMNSLPGGASGWGLGVKTKLTLLLKPFLRPQPTVQMIALSVLSCSGPPHEMSSRSKSGLRFRVPKLCKFNPASCHKGWAVARGRHPPTPSIQIQAKQLTFRLLLSYALNSENPKVVLKAIH